jgi:2,5-diamino-6-(ribosylamino)-4(3H)-pyrimidinone 5'-phosphate reductase
MLSSVDGKISTGDRDILDVDRDFPKIKGVREGLTQYYELEKLTDAASLNSGRTQAKIGVNTRGGPIKKIQVDFVVVDNKPHLNKRGIEYFLKRGRSLILVTTNRHHPAMQLGSDSLKILRYHKKIDFQDFFSRLKSDFKINRLTIQTGGSLNAALLRAGLIDYVSIVVAPVLIGGRDTVSLIAGESLHTVRDLKNVRALKLLYCRALKDSYLHLYYKVIN